MSRRLALGLTWVAATVVAVFVAMQAVGAIGDQVTSPSSASGRRAEGTAQSSPSSTTASTTVAAAPASTTTPATAAAAAATGSAAPAPAGAEAATGGPASPAAPSAPSADDAASSAASEAPASQGEDDDQHDSNSPETPPAAQPGSTTTYNVEGGSIGVRCTGSAIELVYSSPAPGFSSDVNSAGPGEVDVRFESNDHKSRIRVQCASGTPEVTDQREEPA